MGWSGFRIRTPLNRPDVMDEVAVFQGASYFRAVARGTLYGLSARGLAIGTSSPRARNSRCFGISGSPSRGRANASVLIYALLDSRSVSGAFEFRITPGAETLFDTRVAIFPRNDMKNCGIAPLTSMYWFGRPTVRA